MEKKEQIGFHRGATILLISSVAVKIIGALFKIPISSDYCLSDRGFGYFSYAYDFFTPIYTVAMSGFPVALAQMIARRSKTHDGDAAFRSAKKLYTRVGFVSAFLILIICLFRLAFSGKSSAWILPIILIAPAALFCSAMSSYRGYYEGYGDMTPTAVSELIEAGGKLVLGFSFAYVTVRYTHDLAFGAAAAMCGITLGTAFAWLYLKLTFKKRHSAVLDTSHLRKQNDPDVTRTLISMALPITLAALSVNMAPLIDAVTAQARLGAVLYGLRAKAYTLYNLVPAFAVLLSVSAVPDVAHAISGEKKEDARQNIRTVIKYSSLVCFPMAAGLIAASDRTMQLLYGGGDSVTVGGTLLRIFGASAFCTGLAIPMTGILQALGKQKRALFNIAVGAIVKIILNIVLVSLPSIHVYGTAYATLACYVTIFLLHSFTLSAEISLFTKDAFVWIKPLIASFICGGTAWGLLQISPGKLITLLAIAAAVVVYILLLLLLKCFQIVDLPEEFRNTRLVKFCRKHRILR